MTASMGGSTSRLDSRCLFGYGSRPTEGDRLKQAATCKAHHGMTRSALHVQEITTVMLLVPLGRDDCFLVVITIKEVANVLPPSTPHPSSSGRTTAAAGATAAAVDFDTFRETPKSEAAINSTVGTRILDELHTAATFETERRAHGRQGCTTTSGSGLRGVRAPAAM